MKVAVTESHSEVLYAGSLTATLCQWAKISSARHNLTFYMLDVE